MTKQLLMANEAFAHAALEAGVRVVAGYPGTPSSELIETVAKLHASGAAQGVHVEWSTNEKCALELLAGVSYAGARTLFTCKQVGLNVASDPLMSLNYVGVKGGMVLFVCDDPGPISSQTEQDTRRFASFAKVPVLDPSTPEQGFSMMKAAFDLSERYHTPVILRPTTRICHASTFFDVADRTEARPVPEEGFERDSKWVIFPKRSFEAHGEINDRLPAIARDFTEEPGLAEFNPIFEGGNVATGAAGAGAGADAGAASAAAAPRLGIVAGGVSAAYAREALRMLEERAAQAGVDVPAYRFWQVGTPYPFPEQTAARFVEGLDQVLVLEELDNVLEDALLTFAGRTHAAFDVKGRLTGDARDRGENDVDDVAERIARFLGVDQAIRAATAADDVAADDAAPAEAAGAAKAAAPVPAHAAPALAVSRETFAYDPSDTPLPARPPVLCAGCPHRGSFYAVKRALGGRPAVLCGDIGCYTLGNAKPLDAVDTCLCMGAGITMAQGFDVAEPDKKHVAFVGDSTFFASGLTGVVNAVYNGHDIMVCVLDNATTAMTGSQPHPGTGVTLMGPKNKPVSIEAVLRAVGFECVLHADPLKLEESIAAAKEALDFEGPSAVLFESPCTQLKRPGAPASVDVEACRGCRVCIKEIGCPGIGFDADARGPLSGERGQAFVDASLCNGCGLCAQVCPFGAIEVPGGGGAGPGAAAGDAGLAASAGAAAGTCAVAAPTTCDDAATCGNDVEEEGSSHA